jgi:integrase
VRYSEYLETKNLTNETIKTYKKRIKFFVANKEDLDKFKNKSKNYLNQTKNAIKHYHRMKDNFYHQDTILFSKLEKRANKKPKEKEDPLQLKKVNLRINAIRDKRKKLAFRLQQISGLRISEIASLEKNDINFCDDDRLIINVNGKGNKQRELKTLKDKYVYEGIKELQERKGKLFYSARTLQAQAEKLDFHTHDLRKVFAQQIYYKFSGNEKDRIKLLHELLGHSNHRRNKTYLKYINREINFTGTKFDL